MEQGGRCSAVSRNIVVPFGWFPFNQVVIVIALTHPSSCFAGTCYIMCSSTRSILWTTHWSQHCITICILSLPWCEYNDGLIHPFDATYGSLYLHVEYNRNSNMLADHIPFDIYGWSWVFSNNEAGWCGWKCCRIIPILVHSLYCVYACLGWDRLAKEISKRRCHPQPS